jgi:hypothetical protein
LSSFSGINISQSQHHSSRINWHGLRV